MFLKSFFTAGVDISFQKYRFQYAPSFDSFIEAKREELTTLEMVSETKIWDDCTFHKSPEQPITNRNDGKFTFVDILADEKCYIVLL